jgi:DNA polymerase-4
MNTSAKQAHWIAHVDLDAFFASCEQRDHPEYRGRPVVVGAQPGNRGVVAAASYEAREFGIRSAMPISDAYRRCPDAVYLRPNMEKYRDASREVFAALTTISPLVEKASVDEAYLDVSGLEKLMGSPQCIGARMRECIEEKTSLTASVGIGPNRLIAKLGSESCKPDGLRVIGPDEVLDFMAPMPVSNLRGLGKQTQKIFSRLGIHTVMDLRAFPQDRLVDALGARAAESFRRQAFGKGSSEIVPNRGRKSISKENTFGTDVTDHDRLHDTLLELAAGVARTARRERLAGLVVTLKVRFTGFETYTRQKKLAAATNDEREILRTACRLFLDSKLPRKPVRLIGVGLSQWATDAVIQTDLFEPAVEHEQDQKLLETIDDVAAKFGSGKLQIGMARKPRD